MVSRWTGTVLLCSGTDQLCCRGISTSTLAAPARRTDTTIRTTIYAGKYLLSGVGRASAGLLDKCASCCASQVGTTICGSATPQRIDDH